MPLSKTPTRHLFGLAKARGKRENLAGTALWRYSTSNPKGKILLIHGFRGNHNGLSAIAAALEEYEVLIPDLPGYGKSEELLGSHDLKNYGRWLADLYSELDPETMVLGHSFGSLVVGSAIAQGMRPAAVILQNPITTRSSEQSDIPNRVARFFYRAALGLGPVGSALLRSWLVVRVMSIAMATTSNLRLRSLIHQQHHHHFSNYRSDRVAHEGFMAASSGNVLDYAQWLQMPVLLIAGERDSIAPLRNQVLAHQLIAGSELVVIPKVGHLTHYETPIEVAVAVDEFASKL